MTTTTTLVHRPLNGPLEWWREAMVYEIPSPELNGQGLARIQGLLDHVLWLGFSSVLIRPSRLSLPAGTEALRTFTSQAHERGLRVIGRVSGALGPVTGIHARDDQRYLIGAEKAGDGLLERAEAFLSVGVDGIDFGTIIPPEVAGQTDLAQLTEYFTTLQGLITSYVDDGVIGADVSAAYPDSLLHHLQEDWLHHLRDDSLLLAGWNVESLTRHLSRSLADHDRFGSAPAWRHLPCHGLDEDTAPGPGRPWSAVEEVERLRRTAAMQALMLALPGAVYLRQGDEISIPDRERPDSPVELALRVGQIAPGENQQLGSPLANVRHAAHLRRDRRLAAAPLAFVTGMDWSRPDVFTLLARDVLVVVNTAEHAVALPEHAEVLMSSQLLGRDDNHVLVPPTTTTWIEASTVA